MMKCLLALISCLLFAASGWPASDSTADPHQLALPYAQFGFDVLRELASNKSDQNIFVSPTSIAVALAMTSNGASGATQQAILQTLHSDGQSVDTFNAANRALEEQIAGTTAVQLSMVNALWLQQDIPVNPSFTQILQAAYSAQAKNLDFRKASAVETINTWVAKQTNDRIPKILDQVDPSTVAVLTNAIAFKGKWTLQFDPKVTEPHDFKMANRTLSKVQMMQHTAEYGYSNAEGLEAIRLSYADGTFAMYVVLPKDVLTMQSFLRQLTADSFTKIVSSLHPQRGTIEIPRFTITYDATLNAILTKLGVGNAFSDHANFEGICKAPPHLRISEVRHASFLKVDEEGTEAAAATSIGIRATAIRIEPPPFHMVVDHPFFLAIRDERNGQILFTGSIGKPVS